MKGKDIILSDFLPWQKNDDSDPSEIIPISFNAYRILEENRKIDVSRNEQKFLIKTHSQAKTSGTKLPQVHSARKELNPNLRPEKQHARSKKGMTERLHIGQGRAALRRRREPDRIDQPSDVTRRISERSKIATGITNNQQHTNAAHDRGINSDKLFSPDVLLHPDPLHIPLPKQQNVDKLFPTNQDTNININLDIEENSTFQEDVISETIQRPDKMSFQNLKRLKDLIDTGNLIHKFLPKQIDIHKILHII